MLTSIYEVWRQQVNVLEAQRATFSKRVSSRRRLHTTATHQSTYTLSRPAHSPPPPHSLSLSLYMPLYLCVFYITRFLLIYRQRSLLNGRYCPVPLNRVLLCQHAAM